MYTRSSLLDTFESLFYDSFANLPREKKPFLPYNIYKKEDNLDEVFIELSVAGYPKESLIVEEREGYIYIAGKIEDNKDVKYLHKGLTSRNFEFSIPFNSNYTIKDVELENGILRISINRPVPAVRQLEIKTREAA